MLATQIRSLVTREPLRSALIFGFILAIEIIFKADTLNQPYFWDSMQYVIPAALDWAHNSARLIPVSSVTSHPPLLFSLLALAWRLGGETLMISHLVTLSVAAIGLFYTFKLGTWLYHSKRVGIIAVVLLFFYPLFFAQLGVVLTDMPVLAASVVTVYYYLKQNRAVYLLAGTLLVLTKETGMILLLCIFLFDIVKRIATHFPLSQPHKFLLLGGESLVLLVPGLFVILWILYRQSQTTYPFITRFDNLGWYRHVFRRDALRYFLVGNFLFILSLPILIYLIRLVRRGLVKTLVRPEALFLLYFLATLTFYSLTDDFARYFLPVYPFLFILGAAALYDLFIQSHKAILAYATTGLVITLFVSLYPGDRSLPPWELDSTLAYYDAIETHLQADSFILLNYPEYTVLTTWPMNDELSNPKHGYVSRRVDAVYLSPGMKLDPTRDYIILFSPESDQPNLLKMLDPSRLTRLASFEKNGRLAEVYLMQRDRTSSQSETRP